MPNRINLIIMEQKLVKVPFNIEMAKKITNGEIKGKIVTRDGRKVRIVCWDARNDENIVALVSNETDVENIVGYLCDGHYFTNGDSYADLFLEIPECLTFKDGDILTCQGEYEWTFIFRRGKQKTSCYAAVGGAFVELSYDAVCVSDSDIIYLRLATNYEKQKLIKKLKLSKDGRAKEYLRRFFRIEQEEKPKREIKPFDRVLVRQSEKDNWEAALFSNYTSNIHRYRCGGMNYMYCIPYEGNEHLLGTTDDYKEE